MIRKKENLEKVKFWTAKLKEKQRVDIPRAKVKTRNIIEKYASTIDDFIEAEMAVEELQREVDSIKKVIRRLKREQ